MPGIATAIRKRHQRSWDVGDPKDNRESGPSPSCPARTGPPAPSHLPDHGNETLLACRQRAEHVDGMQVRDAAGPTNSDDAGPIFHERRRQYTGRTYPASITTHPRIPESACRLRLAFTGGTEGGGATSAILVCRAVRLRLRSRFTTPEFTDQVLDESFDPWREPTRALTRRREVVEFPHVGTGGGQKGIHSRSGWAPRAGASAATTLSVWPAHHTSAYWPPGCGTRD